MYKLLVLDMDGTLLNDHKKISEKNKLAIKKAREKGVKVVVASGRAVQGIERYLKELDLLHDDQHCVVCSGSLAMNNTKTKRIWNDCFNLDQVKRVYQMGKNIGVDVNLYTDTNIVTHSNNFYSQVDAIENNLPLKVVDFDKLDDDMNITKMMFINEDASILSDIQDLFRNIPMQDVKIESKEGYDKDLFSHSSKLPKELMEEFTVVKVTPYILEIMNKSANKRVGVEKVAKELGIKQEEIMCIGDSGNDMHMIEYAGMGVAMGNAFPELKEVADYVTLTNEEDGVAHAIEKFIL